MNTHHREQAVSHAIAGIDLDGLLEQLRGLRLTRRIVPGQCIAPEDTLVGLKTRRTLAARAIRIGHLNATYQRAHDLLRDLVLDRKDLGCVSVIAIAPDLLPGRGIDQLHSDTDAITQPAYAALDHKSDIELARNAGDRDDGAAVLERGQAGADLQQPPAGKLGDDVLAEAVTEYFLLRIAAQIAKGQYTDRHPGGPGGARWCAL